jgi:hypothetical protein
MHQQQDPREQGSTPDVGDLSNLSQPRILIPSYRSHCNSSTLLFLFVTLQHRDARALLAFASQASRRPCFFARSILHLADYLLRP